MLKKLLFVWILALALHLSGCAGVHEGSFGDMQVGVAMNTTTTVGEDEAHPGKSGSQSLEAPAPQSTPGAGDDPDEHPVCPHEGEERVSEVDFGRCSVALGIPRDKFVAIDAHADGSIPAGKAVAFKVVGHDQILSKTLKGADILGVCIVMSGTNAKAKLSFEGAQVGKLVAAMTGNHAQLGLLFDENSSVSGQYQFFLNGNEPYAAIQGGGRCPEVHNQNGRGTVQCNP